MGSAAWVTKMCATILDLRGSLNRYQSLTGLWRPTKASRTLGNLRKAVGEPYLGMSFRNLRLLKKEYRDIKEE
jgi:hypothetical protein